ncbi:MAG TPA: hypothetical protein VEX37_08020, partial [Thermomicrobiales bacterium]|nr:hypothetical protein [Thermomicrobiales bacterium]
MICPQCATRNELGSQRCRACRRPFTHDAYQAAAPARRFQPRRGQVAAPAPVPGWTDEHGRQPAEPFDDTGAWSGPVVTPGRPRRKRRPHGCLIAFGVLSIVVVGLLVAALLASTYIVKPMVRDAAVTDLQAGVRDEVSSQLAAQIVEDAPEGEIIITDDEINQRLASTGDLGPIDDVTITIAPDVITVDLSAYGLTGTYQSVIRAENGSVVLDSGSLDGPLGFVIPGDELAEAANAEIAAALSAAGYRVES